MQQATKAKLKQKNQTAMLGKREEKSTTTHTEHSMAEKEKETTLDNIENKTEEKKEKTETEIKFDELSKKFPLSMGLSTLKPRATKKNIEPYKGFSSIYQTEINTSSRVFVTLYSMYERKPFLEPVEDQETLENVTAEITFGISDDAFQVDVSVAETDRWLVPQDNVGVSFENGFCETSLEPVKDQYGAVDVNIEVHDVGGVSKHEFTLTIAQDQTKIDLKSKTKKKTRRFKMTKSNDDGPSDTGEDFEERSPNPRRWLPMHVCDWMLEKGLSKYAKIFATKEVNGDELLKLEAEDLRDNFGVVKTRDRDKFVFAIQKIREEAEIADYAEKAAQLEDEEREKLRLEKEARRAVARGQGVSGGGDEFVNSADIAASGLDPWLCGHAPRITRGECGNVDMDAYGIMAELQKIQRLDHGMLR